MANLKGWKNVRPGSTVEIRVVDSKGKTKEPFVASAEIVGDDGKAKKLDDQAIRPGPGTAKLTGGRYYDGRIWIRFAGKGTAVITVTLLKPGGKQHGKKGKFTIKGKKNQRRRATITVRMKKVTP